MKKLSFDQISKKADKFIKKHDVGEEKKLEKIKKYKEKKLGKITEEGNIILSEIILYVNKKNMELEEDEKEEFAQNIDRYISQIKRITEELTSLLNTKENNEEEMEEESELEEGEGLRNWKLRVKELKEANKDLKKKMKGSDDKLEKEQYTEQIKLHNQEINEIQKENSQKEKKQEDLTKEQKEKIRGIKKAVLELENRLDNTNNEEEKESYKSIIKRAEREIRGIKEIMVKKSIFKKVSSIAEDTFNLGKKVGKSVSRAFKTPEGRAMIGNQVYKSVGSILAIKSLADWSGYLVAKSGESKVLKETKLGKKMSKLGNRTDTYKWLEQKKESKKGREEINNGFIELLEIINKKEDLYNIDEKYNKEFSRLTDEISKELDYVKNNFTIFIKQNEQDIKKIDNQLRYLENISNTLKVDKKLSDTKEVIDLKNILKEKEGILTKFLNDRSKYIAKNIKPLSLERHTLKENKEKALKFEGKLEDSKESLKEKISLYKQAIDSSRTPAFYDLSKEERGKIELKIEKGALTLQEKNKYFLSGEDKISLKRRLGTILLDNMKKKEEVNEKMNDSIDKVTADYIRGKVSGVTIAKDALNTLVISTLGPAFRGLVYGGSAMAERFQNKKYEYNKKYEGRDVVGKGKFLLEDTFFNSTLELYHGFSGKQLNIDYTKDAYGKVKGNKRVENLEGLAKLGRVLKSAGELTRGGMIGFQAFSATFDGIPMNFSEIKEMNVEEISQNLQNNLKEVGDSFKETISAPLYKVFGNMGENLFDHAKHTLRIDRFGHKSENEISLEVGEEQSVNTKESLKEVVKTDSTEVTEKAGILKTMKKNLDESNLNNENSAFIEETLETEVGADSLDTNSLETEVSTEVPEKYLGRYSEKVNGMYSEESVNEANLSALGISENISNNEEVTPDTMVKLLALKGRSDSNIDDILENNDSCAIVAKGEGVSQALGKFEDSNMKATVINPDGTRIEGDINLAHVGDTVIQKDGEIYILKTSGVKVSENDGLIKEYYKIIEKKLGHKLTAEEKVNFDIDKDGEVEWNETKKVLDDLKSEKPEVVVDQTSLAKDKSILDEKINELREQILKVKELESHKEDFFFSSIDKNEYLDKLEKEINKMDQMKLNLNIEENIDVSNEESIVEVPKADVEVVGSDEDSAVQNKKTSDLSKLDKENKKELKISEVVEIGKSTLYEQLMIDKNAPAMSKLNSTTDTTKIIRLGKSIEMRSDDGSFVKVDRFRFAGNGNTGKHFEYFKVGDSDPSEKVIFKITENENGNSINNIEIKGYKKINEVDITELEQASEDIDIIDVNQEYGLGIKNADYYDNITKATLGMNKLKEEMTIDANGKNIQIDKLDLVSKVGKIEDGEITKHFIAHSTDGKEYSFITKEHWNTQDGSVWGVGDEDSSVSHLKGEIEYSATEIVNNTELLVDDFDVGDTKIIELPKNIGKEVIVEKLKGDSEFNIIIPHEDENNAVEAAREACGGRVIYFKGDGGRNLDINIDGKKYEIDPNRSFTETGIRNEFKRIGLSDSDKQNKIIEYLNEATKPLKKAVLENDHPILTLHQNGSGYNIEYYKTHPGVVENFHINENLDSSDFYYVNSKQIFEVLKEKDYNVIFQNNKESFDNGSMSYFATRNGRTYINIEVNDGDAETQKKMIKVINEIVKEDSSLLEFKEQGDSMIQK